MPRVRNDFCSDLRLLSAILVISFPAFPQPIADGCSNFLGNIILSNESPPSDFDSYWNQVTVENGGKWGEAERIRDRMNWGPTDAAYNYAKQRDFPFKHHCFLWNMQKPNWIDNLSAADQKAEIEEWIRLYSERYPETELVDVVNEPRDHTPSFKNAIGGDGATGWDWIIWAFETVRKYLPNAILLINEYNVESNMTNALKYRDIISILHERNLVDGVGIQCHVADIQKNGPTIDTIRHCIDTLASVGVPIYPSELDLEGDDQKQLADYKRIFPYLWEHPSTRGITLWGYQGNMWNPGAVLIANGAERPALKWLRHYVDSLQSVNAALPTTFDPQGIRVRYTADKTLRVYLSVPHTLSLCIVDIAGRTVCSIARRSLAAGTNALSLPSLAPGIYVISIAGDRSNIDRKFTIMTGLR